MGLAHTGTKCAQQGAESHQTIAPIRLFRDTLTPQEQAVLHKMQAQKTTDDDYLTNATCPVCHARISATVDCNCPTNTPAERIAKLM